MSTVAISYRELSNASDSAHAVAKKIDGYADFLYDKVYRKLNKCDGNGASNVSTAMSRTNQKIAELRREQQQYETYSNDLDALCETCKNVDNAVRSKVSSLTAVFKEEHGIRDAKILNAVNYFLLDKIVNKTAAGRWLERADSWLCAKGKRLTDSIKEWYNYDGGKEFLEGALIAVLEIAVAVLTLVSGGTIFAMIAAAIALAGGICNLLNEFRGAYQNMVLNDPATAKRRSDINSAQDWLRKSDSKLVNGGATLLDGISLICGIATVITGARDLIGKGYKWATGETDMLKKLDWKKVFSWDGMKKIGSETWSSIKRGGKTIQNAFKTRDFHTIGRFMSNYHADFIGNLKETFSMDNLKSVKNGLKLGKDLVKNGLTLGVVFEHVLAPNLNLGQFTDIDTDRVGQLGFEWDHIKVSDVWDVFDDANGKVIENDLFHQDTPIKQTVFNKLQQIDNMTNIRIPDVRVPDMTLNYSIVAGGY